MYNNRSIETLVKAEGLEKATLVPKIYTYPELQAGIELGNQKVIVVKVTILGRSTRYIDLNQEFYKIRSINRTWDLTGKLKIIMAWKDWSYMWSAVVEEPWIAEKELKLTGNNQAFSAGIALMSLHCLHIVK